MIEIRDSTVKQDSGVQCPCVKPVIEPDDHTLWMAIRQGLLFQIDAIERMLKISPRTAELRRQVYNK